MHHPQLAIHRSGFFLLLVFCLNAINPVYANEDSGKASAVDGDGVLLNGTEHRLHGIDAFELDQLCRDDSDKDWYCGVQAKKVLSAMIKNATVTCEWSDKDKYGRPLSTCHVADINLNAAMVFAGYAVAYRYYSDEYIATEDQARQRRNGVWAGKFLMPWIHRKSGVKAIIPVPDKSQPIKGNINKKGLRYYHCPGDRSYANTRITVAKGEQWFASSVAAEAAGWSRPPGSGSCGL